MPIRNILIIAILLLIISLPFVTKANDNEGEAGVRILRDISYTDAAVDAGNSEAAQKIAVSKAHLLDIYIPTKAKSPTPLVIFIHGGAWLQGAKEEGPGIPLCRKGFACASINYRLTDAAIFPAQIEDCKAAVRFLRAHAADYNIDPQRIGVWGVSAGGHLASLLGTTCGDRQLEGNLGNNQVDSCVQAVCDWCGPSDFLSVAKQAGSRTKIDYDSPKGPVALLLGGLQKERAELAAAASPITHVDKSDPPFLIVHGDIDDLVPYAQSQELHKALTEAGVPNKLITIAGGGHSFTSEEQFNHVVDFFNETLVKNNRKFSLNN
jgi:acetyl esterase/lipase